MLVKELADLTGTTVRTIRYYHQIGLVPVPGTRQGRRNYDLSHVARVSRIRWLVQAGVPLSRIATVLDQQSGPTDNVLADLIATADAINHGIAELSAQRARTLRLIEAAQRGDLISPMPAVVAGFYDDLAARATDEKVQRAIRQERDFMELAYYRGDMPPQAEAVYQGLNEARLAESLAGFHALAARSGGDIDVEKVAAATVEAAMARLGTALPQLIASLDPAVACRAAQLYVRVNGDDRLARAIADMFIAAIEEARN
ncbi:MerR family transcriptional regulator [Actinoplanes sp. GCM10030250]|uniref:helix-turn-helix domain-containing protein n=1 Tax=Actinoplanes sp. GCM10030250 TaxID=3273376 RepID=UPI00361B569F